MLPPTKWWSPIEFFTDEPNSSTWREADSIANFCSSKNGINFFEHFLPNSIFIFWDFQSESTLQSQQCYWLRIHLNFVRLEHYVKQRSFVEHISSGHRSNKSHARLIWNNSEVRFLSVEVALFVQRTRYCLENNSFVSQSIGWSTNVKWKISQSKTSQTSSGMTLWLWDSHTSLKT